MNSDLIVECRGTSPDTHSFEEAFATFSSRRASEFQSVSLEHQRHYFLILFGLAQNRQCEFWIARSKSTGKILARLGADNPSEKNSEGSLGFFDCDSSDEGQEAARHLIDLALEWLKNVGVKSVFGPMDFNSWFHYRFKIKPTDRIDEGEDLPWEPAAPTHHHKIFSDMGFAESIRFSSFFFELARPDDWNPYLADIRKHHQKLTSAGFTFRPLKTGPRLKEDLVHIHSISTRSFSQNPMYEDIPLDVFLHLTMNTANSSDISPSRLCFSPQGEAVGFLFAFLLRATAVYKTVAVIPECQSLGISIAMTYEMSLQCKMQNIVKCVGAMIRNGNRSERIGEGFGSFAKSSGVNNYVLMQRTIP